MKQMLFITLMFLSATVEAQYIEYFNCQIPTSLSNQKATVEVALLQDDLDGAVVYTETHKVKSDADGVLNIAVGKGKTNGSFQNIDWSKHSYFAKFEVLVAGEKLSVEPMLLYEPKTDNTNNRIDSVANALMSVADSSKNVQQEFNRIHDYVDLGLTSGTLWATTNIGAANPQDYGWYFAWAETYPKERYDDVSYRKHPLYQTEQKKLDAIEDAAAAIWGGSWVMPTNEQQKELMDECYWVWTKDYNKSGVAGFIVYKAKDAQDKGVKIYEKATANPSYTLDDAHIFLPAAGYIDYIWPYNNGSSGYYRSSSYTLFIETKIFNDANNRYQYSINRPNSLIISSKSVYGTNQKSIVQGYSIRPCMPRK